MAILISLYRPLLLILSEAVLKRKQKTTKNVEVAIGDDEKLYVPGTDTTLTVENSVTDAKVTGDKLSSLDETKVDKRAISFEKIKNLITKKTVKKTTSPSSI